MAKAKAKSKPCAKAKCKGKGKGKGKGRGKGKGFGRGTELALQGLARRQAASRKRKEQVLEQMPGPAVEEDPEIAELQEELASQLLDTNVDDGANPDSLALPAEPCVHAPSPREPAPSLEPCADPPSPHTGEGEPRPPAEEPCVDAWWCRGRTRGNNSASTAIQWDLAGSNIRAKGQWNGTGLVLERISPCAGP